MSVISLSSTTSKVDRLEDNNITLVMEDSFFYIKNNDDCQFTVTELKGICKGICKDFIPDEKTKEEAARYGKK